MPKNTTQKISLSASVTDELSDKRLDQVASVLFSQYSRTRLQSWIKNGELTVDDKILRSKDKVQAGQVILVNATLKSEGNGQAQDIKLDIVYEDQDIIVIGGKISNSWKFFSKAMYKTVKERYFSKPCRIVKSNLKGAGVLGAAALVLEGR